MGFFYALIKSKKNWGKFDFFLRMLNIVFFINDCKERLCRLLHLIPIGLLSI